MLTIPSVIASTELVYNTTAVKGPIAVTRALYHITTTIYVSE